MSVLAPTIVNVQEITDNLRTFNEQLQSDGEEIEVRAFFLEEDEELEDTVANVVYVATDGDADFSIEDIDRYCERVGDHLGDSVAFTYCIYRTAEEYEKDFQGDYWENVLVEVPNAS